MSRVGKLPVAIPAKAKVEIANGIAKVTGPKGNLSFRIPVDITATVQDNAVHVTRRNDSKSNRALHGMSRALLQNMVNGVTTGYEKTLELIGIGYRCEQKGKHLIMYLGYSHPVLFFPPDDVTLAYQQKENRIVISGIDKELVGLVAAKIRSLREPEPYKGKGIRYLGEQVKIKAGKTAGK